MSTTVWRSPADNRATAHAVPSPSTFSAAWFLRSRRAARTSQHRLTRPGDELFVVMGGWISQRRHGSCWRASLLR
jgi:hypothetical protein